MKGAGMHIPDGFLDAKTWISMSVITTAIIGWSLKKTNESIGEKQVPLMGISAAFIFAAQMLNFPIAGGTSGHFLGGCLAALLLGPYAGLIVMSLVFIVQCFLFQDGGLTALGANIFNAGVAGGMLSYVLLRLFGKVLKGNTGFYVSTFIVAFLSVLSAAVMASLQLAFSGTYPLDKVLVAMTSVHALIGIGEAIITIGIISLVRSVRPDLIEDNLKGILT